MPKKFTIILTLICLPALLGTANVFADDTKSEESMHYWTVEELIKLNDELEVKKEQKCSGDTVCEREFYQELRMDDLPENNILDMFNNFRIIVTRINPSAETVQMLYHDTDAMMREFGETQKQALDELNLVWLDASLPDPRTDFTWVGHPHFVDQIHGGALEDGVHLLFTKSIANDGQDFITPNQEVEFKTSGNELSNNTTSTLHYAGVIGTWQPYGAFEYGDCLASPNYRPGMECRYVFYEDFTRGYLPFEIKSETESTIDAISDTETTPVSETESSEEPANNAALSVAVTSNVSPSDTTTQNITSSATTSTTSTSTIGVPEAITEEVNMASSAEKVDDRVEVPLASEHNEEHIFPWWLVVFGFSGIALILFWFIPARKKHEN